VAKRTGAMGLRDLPTCKNSFLFLLVNTVSLLAYEGAAACRKD
jgi:hypothetical protein